jgi:hypothetical protein
MRGGRPGSGPGKVLEKDKEMQATETFCGQQQQQMQHAHANNDGGVRGLGRDGGGGRGGGGEEEDGGG